MKNTVWIRPGANERDITLRLDTKYENRDTPSIQFYGNRLLAALESMAEPASPNEKAQTP